MASPIEHFLEARAWGWITGNQRERSSSVPSSDASYLACALAVPSRDLPCGARLGWWLDWVIRHHDARILPVDTDIALQAGLPLAMARAAGVEPDTTDAWIGATAKVHGLEVLTFNMADFRPMGIACRHPMSDLPQGWGRLVPVVMNRIHATGKSSFIKGDFPLHDF